MCVCVCVCECMPRLVFSSSFVSWVQQQFLCPAREAGSKLFDAESKLPKEKKREKEEKVSTCGEGGKIGRAHV